MSADEKLEFDFGECAGKCPNICAGARMITALNHFREGKLDLEDLRTRADVAGPLFKNLVDFVEDTELPTDDETRLEIGYQILFTGRQLQELVDNCSGPFEGTVTAPSGETYRAEICASEGVINQHHALAHLRRPAEDTTPQLSNNPTTQN